MLGRTTSSRLCPACYPSPVMIHITEISKSFGTQVILDRASLHIRPGMRIGLVGPNGAGKTTLLRVLAGETSLDQGEINARKGLRIGFLPQEIEEIADHAVLDEVLTSYADILDMEHRLKDLGDRIAAACGGASAEDADALMRELGALQTAFEAATATSSSPAPRPSCGAWDSATTTSPGPSASSPGGGACGWRWPGCSWSPPTSCCSTSPPTTSTWRASSGWRSSCWSGPAPW
ncbi:MAG: hypothetical protein Kow00122_08790 [Thermoleophilia bacterium]